MAKKAGQPVSRQRNIARMTISLALIAFGFYVAFIVMAVVKS